MTISLAHCWWRWWPTDWALGALRRRSDPARWSGAMIGDGGLAREWGRLTTAGQGGVGSPAGHRPLRPARGRGERAEVVPLAHLVQKLAGDGEVGVDDGRTRHRPERPALQGEKGWGGVGERGYRGWGEDWERPALRAEGQETTGSGRAVLERVSGDTKWMCGEREREREREGKRERATETSAVTARLADKGTVAHGRAGGWERARGRK